MPRLFGKAFQLWERTCVSGATGNKNLASEYLLAVITCYDPRRQPVFAGISQKNQSVEKNDLRENVARPRLLKFGLCTFRIVAHITLLSSASGSFTTV